MFSHISFPAKSYGQDNWSCLVFVVRAQVTQVALTTSQLFCVPRQYCLVLHASLFLLLFVELVCPGCFGPVKSTANDVAEVCYVYCLAAVHSSHKEIAGFRESTCLFQHRPLTLCL